MKRTILAVLMVVIVATPCLAQEVEPDGIFSLNKSLWWQVVIAHNSVKYGFYEGDVYFLEFGYPDINRCRLLENSSYLDLLVVSFFKADYSASSTLYGIMYPLGIGWMFSIYKTDELPIPIITTYMVIKENNNFTPSPECEEVL